MAIRYIYTGRGNRDNVNGVNANFKFLFDEAENVKKLINESVTKDMLTSEQYAEFMAFINDLVKKGEVAVSDININLGKIGLSHLSDDVIKAIAGTAPVNAVPADNSITTVKVANKAITADKTDFMTNGKNIFNKEDSVFGSSLRATTGEVVASNYHYLATISVKPGTAYTQSHQMVIVIYDKEGKRVDHVEQINPRATPRTITIPENGAYIKTAVLREYIDTYQIEEGSTSTPYEHFSRKVDKLELNNNSVFERHIGDTNLLKASRHIAIYVGTEDALDFDFENEQIKVKPFSARIIHKGESILLKEQVIDMNDIVTLGWIAYDTSSGLLQLIKTNLEIPAKSVVFAAFNKSHQKVFNIEHYFVNGEPFVPTDSQVSRVLEKTKVTDVLPEQMYTAPKQEGVTPNDTLNLDTSLHTDVYSWYDKLVEKNKGYIERVEEGTDSLGNKIYSYKFKEPTFSTETDTGVEKLPKMIIVTGTHGQEKITTYSLYKLLEEVANNWISHPVLEFMRFNCELIVVPCWNPSGYDANTRQNHNGVDLNRNFEHNWKLTAVGTTTYSGTAPLSEKESQVMDSILNKHKDAIYLADIHETYKTVNGRDFLWIAYDRTKSEKLANLGRNDIIRLSRKWHKDKGYLDASNILMLGYTSDNYSKNAMVMYQALKYDIQATTFETCGTVWFNPDKVTRNGEAVELNMEAIGNHIANALYHVSRN